MYPKKVLIEVKKRKEYTDSKMFASKGRKTVYFIFNSSTTE
jgi:hypothetical protein